VTTTSTERRAKVLRVHQLLLGHYGEPVLKEQRDPLDELVMTILSQNTSDVNSGRAYKSLRRRFPVWEEVLEAQTDDVTESIRSGGLANIKASRIQNILRKLQKERGALDLDFLRGMAVAEGREYLDALPGVGPKTAACVLLFSLHKPALPVDTHVHRVARRLALIPDKASAEKAQVLLEEAVPQEAYYPFHLNMIRHGRTLCKAKNPRCENCPMIQECEHVQSLADR